jgi:predicted dehydrogenase
MNKNAKKRVGLIGVGEISYWHLRALRAAGLDISGVATRPESNRTKSFAEQHGISRVYADWHALLADKTSWDGLVIATPVEGTLDILREAIALGKPILVEKPVAHSADSIMELLPLANDLVLVGYNRRYYRTTRIAKEFVAAGGPLLAHLSLPEGITVMARPDGKSYLYPFYDNSSHGIDMLCFIFGALVVASVQAVKFPSGPIAGFAATLKSQRGDVIDILGNWGTPANFALSLDRPKKRIEMRPFELLTVYEGMDVVSPTDDFPIRRYVPKVVERVTLDEIDLREKPGFVGQAEEFAAMMDGHSPVIGATLEQAGEVMNLCQRIIEMSTPQGICLAEQVAQRSIHA